MVRALLLLPLLRRKIPSSSLTPAQPRYMTPIPFVASALGTTTAMFAAEGVALNAALVGLAYGFRANPTSDNARRMFRYSLVYLPLVLAGFVYHSKTWDEVEDAQAPVETDESLRTMVGKLKEEGRSRCVHETRDKPSGGACPVPDVFLPAKVAKPAAAEGGER